MKHLCIAAILLFFALAISVFPVYSDTASEAAKSPSIPDGKITGVDTTQIDAYTISLRASDGIMFGDTFQIIRDGEVIGEAFLVSTDPEKPVISIKGAAKIQPAPGDAVRFLRHKKELPRTVVTNRTYLSIFRDVEGRADLVECRSCGLKMDKSFILKFNDLDHYAVCKGKSHDFHARANVPASSGSRKAPSSGQQGASGAEARPGLDNINTSRDAQELFKAPENWTEKVSTQKYEDWGKQVRNPVLPSIQNSYPCVSGYGKTDDGSEIKMQVIQSNNCIKVVTP